MGTETSRYAPTGADDESRAHYAHMPAEPLFDDERGTFSEYADDDPVRLYSDLYDYWTHRGFASSILDGVVHLLIILFMALFSSFLAVVDWSGLSGAESPHLGIDYDRLHNPPALLVVYFVIFAAFWLYRLLMFFVRVVHLVRIRRFVSRMRHPAHHRDVLEPVTEKVFRYFSWRDVVRCLAEYQSRHKLARAQHAYDALDIAGFVTNTENYMIALLNEGKLRLNIPCTRRTVISRLLEYNLLFLLRRLTKRLSASRIKTPVAIEEDVSWFRRMLLLAALLNFLLMPFEFVFVILFFVFRYGEEVHKSPAAMLAVRQFTRYSRWQFREYSELPHVFDARLAAAYKPAMTYIDLFRNAFVDSLAGLVAFVVGAFTVVLVLIGLINDDVMSSTDLFGKNFLWFLAVFGAILAATRAVMKRKTTTETPETCMRKVCAHTHFVLDAWRSDAHLPEVYSKFATMFPYKPIVAILELLSLLFTPFVLAISARGSARKVVTFVHRNSYQLAPQVWGCTCAQLDVQHRSAHNKIEQSVVHFEENHPRGDRLWNIPEQSMRLLDAVHRSQNLERSHDSAIVASASSAPAGVSHQQPEISLTSSFQLVDDLILERRRLRDIRVQDSYVPAVVPPTSGAAASDDALRDSVYDPSLVSPPSVSGSSVRSSDSAALFASRAETPQAPPRAPLAPPPQPQQRIQPPPSSAAHPLVDLAPPTGPRDDAP